MHHNLLILLQVKFQDYLQVIPLDFIFVYLCEIYFQLSLCIAEINNFVYTYLGKFSSSDHYSNKSLRKTCATSLHKPRFERADIAKVTGHSSQAIESYVSL